MANYIVFSHATSSIDWKTMDFIDEEIWFSILLFCEKNGTEALKFQIDFLQVKKEKFYRTVEQFESNLFW